MTVDHPEDRTCGYYENGRRCVLGCEHEEDHELETFWQYGIRFGDGSEAWRWCGRTSRLRAETELAHLKLAYSDPFELVRRPVDERGRPINRQAGMPV